MPVQVIGISDDWIPPVSSNKTIVTDSRAFEEMVNRLSSSPAIIFDFETSGTSWFQNARPCGLALGCWDEFGQVRAWYVPYRHYTGEAQLDLGVIGPVLKSILENPNTLKVGHNIKFDDHMARTEGWRLAGPRYDTMVGARFFDENRLIGLKARAASDLNRKEEADFERKLDLYVLTLARNSGLGKEAYLDKWGYSQVPINLCGHYACYDIDFTGNLCAFYEKWGMQAKHPRIWPTEMALTEVLGDVEEWGLPIDVDYLSHLRDILSGHMASLDDRITTMLGGRTLDLKRDAVLRQFLFGDGPGDLHLAPIKRTKGFKEAVDHEVLEFYAPSSPLIKLIMEWRDAHKLASTYTTSILERLDSRNILHGELQSVGTDTGRTSSQKPNLQNFPSDDNDRAITYSGKKLKEGGVDPWSIKRAFVTRGPEWIRLLYDYSQIELRVLAYYSQDPIMVEAYRNGEDLHDRTSLEVFGTKDEEFRRLAKIVNFGLSYCLSANGLARQTHISVEDAEKHMAKFFARYQGIASFRDNFWNQVRSHNCEFQNLFGRYRRVPDLRSSYDKDVERAKRQAIGSLIQGTAAELTKESMVRIWRWLKDEKIPGQICTTIHDEIQIDIPVEYLPRVAPAVKSMMEFYPEFSPIPIIVEGSYTVTNWAEKKKLPK